MGMYGPLLVAMCEHLCVPALTSSRRIAQLKTAIRALGFQVSKVESMKLVAEFDVDNENLVDKESFVKIRACKVHVV